MKMSDISGISYVPRLRASVLRMSASAEARRLKSGGAMLAITGSQGSGVDFSVPVIILMVVLSELSTIYYYRLITTLITQPRQVRRTRSYSSAF